jgi:hypothetical protein
MTEHLVLQASARIYLDAGFEPWREEGDVPLGALDLTEHSVSKPPWVGWADEPRD